MILLLMSHSEIFPLQSLINGGNPINADGSVDTEYTDGNGDTNSRDASRKPGGNIGQAKLSVSMMV